MKIAYCSDLHIEFKTLTLNNTENADVLILAGDICLAKYLKSYEDHTIDSDIIHDFFIDCSQKFKHVIYIAGNHEHYGYKFYKTYDTLKYNLAYIKNLYILDNEIVEIEGIKFLGGTMWADCNNHDIDTKNTLKYVMNDFKLITYKDKSIYRKYQPDDAIFQFVKFINFLDNNISDTCVVISHHAPSEKSIPESRKDDFLINGGYRSNLNLYAYDNIKFWIHGHIHSESDYTIGDTRVLCNPRGYYNSEPISNNFELKYFEL